MNEQRILSEQLRHAVILALFADAPTLGAGDKVVAAEFIVCGKIVISLFGGLSQPIPLILGGAMLPSGRQIGGTEQLGFQRKRVEKLIVQLGQILGSFLAHARDVQRMTVPLAGSDVAIPMISVFVQPGKALALALCQNEFDFIHRMRIAPDVLDECDADLAHHARKVHLMHHAFDIRHTDLEGMMDVLAAEDGVDLLGKCRRDQPLAVKLSDGNLRFRLPPFVSAYTSFAVRILHGNHIGARHVLVRIVHDDDAVIAPQIRMLDTRAAGKQQTVVGVELRELTLADLHLKHHPCADSVVYIGAEKRQSGVAAHAGGTLECEITLCTAAEIQRDSIGTEHGFRFFLPQSNLRILRIAVEDAGEVDVNDHVGEIVNNGIGRSVAVVIAFQFAQDLKEDRVVLLRCFAVAENDAFGFTLVEGDGVSFGIVRRLCVRKNCLRGQHMDFVSDLRHGLTSLGLCIWLLYHNPVNFSTVGVKRILPP